MGKTITVVCDLVRLSRPIVVENVETGERHTIPGLVQARTVKYWRPEIAVVYQKGPTRPTPNVCTVEIRQNRLSDGEWTALVATIDADPNCHIVSDDDAPDAKPSRGRKDAAATWLRGKGVASHVVSAALDGERSHREIKSNVVALTTWNVANDVKQEYDVVDPPRLTVRAAKSAASR